MIDRIKKTILLDMNIEPLMAESLAETIVNIVVAEIVGDIRSLSLVGDKACANCLEVRRKAIDIALSKSPTL